YRDTPVHADARARIVSMLESAPDDHLREMRPFELARIWHLARRDVLRAFIHATRAGLTELRWQLACPMCRVPSASRESLAAIGRRVHCAECQIDFDVDLAANVEAVFQVAPALRDVAWGTYCA